MIVRPLAPAPAVAPALAVRRFPYGFGPRFFLLLAMGLIFAIPAWIDPRAIVALAAWNLLVLGAWALDLRRIPLGSSLIASRSWGGTLTLGAPADVAVEISNDADVPVRVEAIDDVPAALAKDLPEVGTDVAPRGSARAVYTVIPASRGDATLGPIALRVRSPWAIAERWLSAAAVQRVRVYPDLAGARRQSMFLLRSRQVALEKRRTRVVGIGRDFESLRDYQPGDEPRDICWVVAARRGKPVTKVYQPERSQPVWILVDGGRLLRARVGDRTKLDDMVGAALGLAEVALTAGDRVGLLTYGRGVHARLAPSRGGAHLRSIVDALATLPVERAEADHAGAAAAVRAAQRQRALIVWLTDVAETAGVPDVIEQASRLSPQHLVIFGVVRPRELSDLEKVVPDDAAGMYRLLAVQETLDRREVLLRELRQRGVLVLEMDREAPTAALIDQYLSVKERNLL